MYCTGFSVTPEAHMKQKFNVNVAWSFLQQLVLNNSSCHCRKLASNHEVLPTVGNLPLSVFVGDCV